MSSISEREQELEDSLLYETEPAPRIMVSKVEKVNHPKHYNHGKYEVIDVILDWDLNFCRGNVVKYLARAGKKSTDTEIEDLEKASFYLQKELEELRKSKRLWK